MFMLLLFSFLFPPAVDAKPVSKKAKPKQTKCAVKEDAMNWRLQFCMAKLEAGDMEMVMSSPCFTEQAPRFESACAEKIHWKKNWCKATAHDPVERCVANPQFKPSSGEEAGE
jgi:hypothetical protein